MTNVLLRRKGWEADSCNGVVGFMKNKSTTIQTGDDWPADTVRVFRWGCTANTPVRSVVNTADAIHLGADKPRFRRVLRDRAPHTIPLTWFDTDGLAALLNIGKEFPVVVRPKTHERGRDFHMVNTTEQLMEAIAKCDGEYYISKFYDKAQEFRIFLVQGRVAFVVEKIPRNKNLPAWGLAYNWNNVRWGEWNLRVVRIAREAFMESGLAFGAVDIILDKKGDAYVCEVNSAPQLTGEYEQSKVAMCFDYIIDTGKADPIPIIGERGGWRKFIHPAVSMEAQL
jgi:glutathione synthase/RimK-type ligase-like ATP-grasp enzyme